MPDSYVLDSFALIAHLQGESRGARVAELLRSAAEGRARLLLCIINYGEVLYNLERRLETDELKAVISAVDELPIEVVDVNPRLTFAAAHLKARHPLSYADAFAIALAQQESATVVTGDPEFRTVQHLVSIEWLA